MAALLGSAARLGSAWRLVVPTTTRRSYSVSYMGTGNTHTGGLARPSVSRAVFESTRAVFGNGYFFPRQFSTSSPPLDTAKPPTTLKIAKGEAPAAHRILPIKAYYIARSIDFMKYFSEVHSKTDCIHYLQRDGLLLSFEPTPASPLPGTKNALPARPEERRHVYVFGYGAVVFYNFEDWALRDMIQQARAYCKEPFDLPAAEDFAVNIRPRHDEAVYPEFVSVNGLDVNYLRVISSVIGHTVAIDHYENKVNEMLEQFRAMNGDMEKRGAFALHQQMLFKSVATNNAVLTDMIRNLRLLDRSDTAWKSERFSKIWDGLREEFEVEPRFKRLDFKLDLIQLNTKFFLEINQHQKSERLEWIIVWLLVWESLLAVEKLFPISTLMS